MLLLLYDVRFFEQKDLCASFFKRSNELITNKYPIALEIVSVLS